jgi:hypothetical protein
MSYHLFNDNNNNNSISYNNNNDSNSLVVNNSNVSNNLSNNDGNTSIEENSERVNVNHSVDVSSNSNGNNIEY